MKRNILTLLGLLVMVIARGQSYTETIRKELSFEKKSDANALLILNINGSISVKGYDGDKVIVTVEKRIDGKTPARTEKGKQEIQLGILDRADTILLYVQGVCNSFGKSDRSWNGRKRWNGWGYNWNNCNDRGSCEKEYDYEMNFTIQVPKNLNILASTINNGDLLIENVTKSVLADNINGKILLNNISGPTYASAINGDVDLNYASNPPGDSRYYSLNGDINANFKKGLTADISFESFNGDLYTNVDQLESLPSTIMKKPSEKGMKYKIGGNQYRIRTGGVHLDFETFNGNVYVKEN